MKIYIIAGNREEGKTTLLKEVIILLKNRGISMSGFYAEGKFEKGERSSFELTDVNSGKHYHLCRRTAPGNRGFTFDKQNVIAGNKLLEPSPNVCLYIIDEVGKMEIKGEIWHDALQKLIKNGNNLLITVRKDYTKEVVGKFGFEKYKIFDTDDNPSEIAAIIDKEIGYLCKK